MVAVFCLSSSVFQTAALPLGCGGSSRLSCSTLAFLLTSLQTLVVRGFVPMQQSVNKRAGMEQLAKSTERGWLIGAHCRGLVRSRF